jgi:hypothetical protein
MTLSEADAHVRLGMTLRWLTLACGFMALAFGVGADAGHRGEAIALEILY